MLSKDDFSAANDERTIGEWIYEKISEEIVIEKSGWAFEQAQRVAKRLNQAREGCEAIKPVVIWIPQVNAFITQGEYLYISRELLQRLPSDDAIAFVFAHEMAHYDLGHIQVYTSYLSTLKYIPGGRLLALFLCSAKLMFPNPDRERQADEYGLDLCLAAGYEGKRCLEFFDILEAHYLDHGALEGVFGPEETEENLEHLPEGVRQWFSQVRLKLEQRWRSHPDIRSRKEYLLHRLLNQKDIEEFKATSEKISSTEEDQLKGSSDQNVQLSLPAEFPTIPPKLSSTNNWIMNIMKSTTNTLMAILGIVNGTKSEGEKSPKIIRNLTLLTLSIVVLASLTAIFKSLVIIPAGTVGAMETFGKVSEQPLLPGFHAINPFAKVVKFSTRLKDITETINVTTKEGLTLDLDVSLQYKVKPEKIGEIYQNIGLDEKIIVIPRFRSLSRQITSSYEARAIYGTKRQEIAQLLRQQLSENLTPLGFTVEEALLRKVVLPEKITEAIQAKLAAEQESQKLDFEIEKARKEAERNKIEAQGKAEAQRLLSQGLTEEVLRLKAIEATQNLAQSDNSKVIIIGGGQDKLPLILQGE